MAAEDAVRAREGVATLTSQQVRDRYAVGIADIDFAEGTLRKSSNIRPNRLFSASTNLILYRALASAIDRVVEILQAG